jgi:hypothetical protein
MALGPLVHRTELHPGVIGTIWEVFCFDCSWREGVFVGGCRTKREAAARAYEAELHHRAQNLGIRLISTEYD